MPVERQPIPTLAKKRPVHAVTVAVVLAGTLAACDIGRSQDIQPTPSPTESEKALAPYAVEFPAPNITVKDVCKPDGSNRVAGAKPDALSVVTLQADNVDFSDKVGDLDSTIIVYTKGTSPTSHVDALVPSKPISQMLINVDGTHGVTAATQGTQDSCWTLGHIKVVDGVVQKKVGIIPTKVTQGVTPNVVRVY